MIINQSNLNLLYTGFKTSFQIGFDNVPTAWAKIATKVPSSTRTEKYGWLGQAPNMREWLGDRVVQGLSAHDYSIANRSFELTIGVDRDDISDDQYGTWTPLMEEMGRSTAAFPDQLLFGLMARGFTETCFDKQPMFSDAHVVVDSKGKEKKVSNMQAGSGEPWFLLDTSRSLKPFIYQERQKFVFVAKTDPKTSDEVFHAKQYVYGVDGRCNVGFGFWQMAFGSTAPLTKANLRAARKAMMGLTNEHGRPLGIRPNLIVVGTSNSDLARDILVPDRLDNGATNTDRGLVEIMDTPWLA
jgi:phage major head subunit gpT-like protein